MTIESHFYDTKPGEGINEVEWAQAVQSRQSRYGVAKANELLCTPHPSTPYAVNLSPAPSGFWGQGIWDTSDAVETIVCPAPGQNVRRFDLIASHRDWTPTGGGPTTFEAITGSGARAIPSGRKNVPGEVDDQPLYLLEWLGGQTQPQSITDLRLIGGLEAVDRLALKYMEYPGEPVKIGSSYWHYEAAVNGNWAHREYTKAPLVKAGIAIVRPITGGFSTVGYTDGDFPNGTRSVVMTPMDPPNGQLFIKWVGGDKRSFNLRVAATNGGAIVGDPVGFSWIAVGY